MEKLTKVNVIKKRKNAIIPEQATTGAAGVDLHACIDEEIEIKAGESVMIPTGIAIELPSNDMAAFIFARSGLATKFGISLANSVGVVDSDYRGEIQVCLRNFGQKDYIIKPSERIAQLVVMPIFPILLNEVSALSDTTRGEGGFGSTGNF